MTLRLEVKAYGENDYGYVISDGDQEVLSQACFDSHEEAKTVGEEELLRLQRELEVVEGIIAELNDHDVTFRDTVKAGDLVQWREWVWSEKITGIPSDPQESEQVRFTGRVEMVDRDRNLLYVDPATVWPIVRQKPRCCLPIGTFSFEWEGG